MAEIRQIYTANGKQKPRKFANKGKYFWTKEKIGKWHRRVMPKATLSSQVWKLEEEINEYYDSPNRSAEDVADVVIMADVLDARYHLTGIRSIIKAALLTEFDNAELHRVVDRKMRINATERDFVFDGKNYRHVDKTLPQPPEPPEAA